MITLWHAAWGAQRDPEYLLYEGRTFRVEFYFDTRGRMPAREYLEAMTEDEQARMLAVTTHIADSPVGTIHSRTLYNLEDGKAGIYALKPSQHRFFSFKTHDRRIVLTNAYKKESAKMDRSGRNVLRSAVRMKADYEKRRAEGGYYEKA